MAELSAPYLNDPEGTCSSGVLVVLDLVAVVLVVEELLPVPT